MPQQAPLRFIKRCQLYRKRSTCRLKAFIPHITRGVYVLYKDKSNASKKKFEVFYIGVGGVKKAATSGIRSRLRSHDKHKDDWTHYSLFEVHDNISREEILEIEQLLLRIFRHDDRIRLDNVQLGSNVLKQLSRSSEWKR